MKCLWFGLAGCLFRSQGRERERGLGKKRGERVLIVVLRANFMQLGLKPA